MASLVEPSPPSGRWLNVAEAVNADFHLADPSLACGSARAQPHCGTCASLTVRTVTY